MQQEPYDQIIHLVRHGMREDFENPDWKLTAAEPFDTPLSAKGFRQAADVGRALCGQGITALYASPFLRALQTADAIADALDLPIRVEPGLCEWHNPDWMTCAPNLPDARAAQKLFPRIDLDYRPVTGPVFPEVDETVQVRARVKMVLDQLFQHHPPEQAVLVAHGSPIGQAIGLTIPGTDGIHYEVASITTIARTGNTFRLVKSSIDHLTEADREVRFH